MKHVGTKALKTKRLTLRKISILDAKEMYNNWANDVLVTKYLTWKPHDSIELTKTILSMWEKEYESIDKYRWGIVLDEIGEIIGTIDVTTSDEDIKMLEIGYCISRKYWGQGIVTEALKEVINFLFNNVDCNRIQAYHHVENIASGKVMKKAGMKFEGILRDAKKDNEDNLCDIAMYSILRKEYLGEE